MSPSVFSRWTNNTSVNTWSNGDIIAQNLKLNSEAAIFSLDLTVGIEGFWDGTTQVPDVMGVNLRYSYSPYALVDAGAVSLNSSGNGLASYPLTTPGLYYIQLIHRNALETWSSSPVNFTLNSTTNYDFTTAQAQTYGDNSVLKFGKYCCYSGDVNQDGKVEVSDIILVFVDATNFVSGYVDTDLTGDDIVDVGDLVIASNNAAGFVAEITP